MWKATLAQYEGWWRQHILDNERDRLAEHYASEFYGTIYERYVAACVRGYGFNLSAYPTNTCSGYYITYRLVDETDPGQHVQAYLQLYEHQPTFNEFVYGSLIRCVDIPSA